MEAELAWRAGGGDDEEVLVAELITAELAPRFTLGSDVRARLVVPSATSERMGVSSLRLLEHDGARFLLRVPRGVDFLLVRGGVCVELGARLVEEREHALELGDEATIHLGALTLRLSVTTFEGSPPRASRLEGVALSSGLASLTLHALLFAALLFGSSEASAHSSEPPVALERYVSAELAPASFGLEEDVAPVPDERAGGTARAPDEAAAVGNDTPTPHVSRGSGRRRGSAARAPSATQSAEDAFRATFATRLAGMIERVSGAASVVYGEPDVLDGPGGAGFSPRSGGPELDGSGGLALRMAGRGTCVGASCGEGAIAVGPLHTSGDVGPTGQRLGLEPLALYDGSSGMSLTCGSTSSALTGSATFTIASFATGPRTEAAAAEARAEGSSSAPRARPRRSRAASSAPAASRPAAASRAAPRRRAPAPASSGDSLRRVSGSGFFGRVGC